MLNSLVFCFLSVSSTAGAQDGPVAIKLLHDPFKKPERVSPASQRPADGGDVVNSFLENSSLTATLLAGSNSMVIVKGRTLGLGEEIDGYRLIKVLERSAIFIKNKQKFILDIDKVNEAK